MAWYNDLFPTRMKKIISTLMENGKKGTDDTATSSDPAEELLEQLQIQFQVYTQDYDEFELPSDFSKYLNVLKGDFINEIGGFFGAYLLHYKGIIEQTTYCLNTFYTDDSTEKFWVVIGGGANRAQYFLCCNKQDTNFGKVALSIDNTPWQDTSLLEFQDGDLSDFLETLVPNQ